MCLLVFRENETNMNLHFEKFRNRLLLLHNLKILIGAAWRNRQSDKLLKMP